MCKYFSRNIENDCEPPVYYNTYAGTRMQTYMMDEKYVCMVCGKMFSMKGNLSVHMLIHTGERPHQCESCLKVFRHRNSLNRHKRTRHRRMVIGNTLSVTSS